MILSLTKDPAGKVGLTEVPSEMVIYLNYSKKHRMTEIHTIDDIYYAHGPWEFWCDGLRSSSESFAIVDRGIMAQITKIKHIDKFGVAYFEVEVKSTTKRCTLSKSTADFLIDNLKISSKSGSLK